LGSVLIARGQVYCVIAVDSYMFHVLRLVHSRFYGVPVCFGVYGDVIPVAFHLSDAWNVIHLRSMVPSVDGIGVARKRISQGCFLWGDLLEIS
jgi:hypothetical protein